MEQVRGIRQRGDSFLWDVTVSGKRITGTCVTLAAAQKERSEAQKGLRAANPTEPWSLSKAAAKAVEEWEREGSRSLRMSKINVQEAFKYFGERRKVSDITKEDIVGYTKHLTAKGNSPATINRKLSALSKVLKAAEDEGIIVEKPKMPRYKEGRGRERFLSAKEENTLLQLLTSWGKYDHADAVQVLLDTGMRTGELFGIVRRDIVFKGHKAIRVSLWVTKNGHSRTIPLTARASEVITKRCQGLLETDRVFPYNSGWLRNTWDRAREVMGLSEDPQFVPHMLRHTTASRLAQRGIAIPIMKEYLGHLNIQTTMRYAHLTVDSLQQAVSVLEQGIAS